MTIAAWLILILSVLVGLLILVLVIVLKSSAKREKVYKQQKENFEALQLQYERTQKNIEQVLDYEKQDDILVQQREKHVDALVKTRSKEKAGEEIKTLMSNLRDAYNAL